MAHDFDVGLAVAGGPLLRFIGDLEVISTDDHREVTAGVDVAAAALDCQARRPPRKHVGRAWRPGGHRE
jgi:hypothetical protein